MNNLSDGVKDGFVLFYLKNQKLNSVLITQEQADILDMMLNVVFGDEVVRISPSNDVKRYLTWHILKDKISVLCVHGIKPLWGV